MAGLTALKIAALAKARHEYANGELPEPVGLTINRHGHLTLMFAERDHMIAWRELMVRYGPVPPGVERWEAYSGEMTFTEGADHPATATVTTVRVTVVFRS